jgi:hypothetical protein
MNKAIRSLMCVLLFGVVAAGGFHACKSEKAGSGIDWVTVDAAYAPKDAVVEFIKNDAQARGALPVYIKNYGHDPKVLAKFKGKQFATPNPNVLGMFFKGLDDWMIVDIKYKNENEREVRRTMLYVFENKQWKVGDTGSLLK